MKLIGSRESVVWASDEQMASFRIQYLAVLAGLGVVIVLRFFYSQPTVARSYWFLLLAIPLPYLAIFFGTILFILLLARQARTSLAVVSSLPESLAVGFVSSSLTATILGTVGLFDFILAVLTGGRWDQ